MGSPSGAGIGVLTWPREYSEIFRAQCQVSAAGSGYYTDKHNNLVRGREAAAGKRVDQAVFLKSFGNILIIAALAVAAAVWAVPEARAAVVLSDSEVSASAGLGEGLAGLVKIDPVAIARETSLGGMTGLPLVPTDDEREREAQKDRLLTIMHGSLMQPPADMSPSSNSLSHLTGSGTGGFAAPSDLVSPPQAELQASLPPEARMNLPTGPPWRWFRPPR